MVKPARLTKAQKKKLLRQLEPFGDSFRTIEAWKKNWSLEQELLRVKCKAEKTDVCFWIFWTTYAQHAHWNCKSFDEVVQTIVADPLNKKEHEKALHAAKAWLAL